MSFGQFEFNLPLVIKFKLMEFPFELEEVSEITYNFEDINLEIPKLELLNDWIKKIIEQEECVLLLLNFIFCTDQKLHAINLEYLNHDTYTDIITFPFSQTPQIEGDIFISIDRIKENAEKFEVKFQQELFRVMIHGVLHLCGYGDKTEEEKKRMRQKENEALSQIAF